MAEAAGPESARRPCASHALAGRGRARRFDVVERADGVYWYPPQAMVPLSGDAGST